jgi:serine/threonine protein kinase
MDNFIFLGSLGKGAYGEVWRVKCKKTLKIFVVKLQCVSRQSDNEIKVLSDLNKNNIKKVPTLISSGITKN